MKYLQSENRIELSVSELCSLVYRTDVEGDDLLSSEGEDLRCESLLFPEDYRRNVDFSTILDGGVVKYRLFGTADGVFEDGDLFTVDLVRLVSPSDFKKKVREENYAYLKLLGLLLCLREGCGEVALRVVLVNRFDGGFRTEVKKQTRAELESFAGGMLAAILPRVRRLIDHETRVRPTAARVPFPYSEIREGQEQMIRRGMAAIRRGQRLFVQAPTGIGKTVSALYPAVRAFGDGLCDKIFYLTAKSSTAREAYHAVGKLFAAGARLSAIVMTAKEQMCVCEAAKCAGCGVSKFCNPRDCRYLRDYGERVSAAIDELLEIGNGYYASLITEVALRHEVCPYELSLDLSELCDVIICDYNYLFDPSVHFQRYFDRVGDFGEYVFLIDEAHNLVDRARAMYSVTLSKNSVAEILSDELFPKGALYDALSALLAAMAGLRELCRETLRREEDGGEVGYYISRTRVTDFDEIVTEAERQLALWLKISREHPIYDRLRAFWQELRKYVLLLGLYDEKFMTYVEMSGGDTCISLACLDPSEVLDGCLSKGRASIFFSATLTPTSYFSDLLGGGKRPKLLELPSPYDPQNLCVAAVDTVSTRFEDREKSYKKVASCIAAAISGRAGNYIVYFPSYSYLEKVYEAFRKKYPKVNTIVQKKGMFAAEREEFISFFKNDEGRMRVGFCVLGGIFSEGVDLPGTRLIGSVIVGVGLPGFSSERNIMRDYFENRYENGFEYAYTYPGMNSVLQAAGRVIRREEDMGVVVLIDDRYATPTYQKLFPMHWIHLKYAGNPASLAEIVRSFWEKKEK